MKLREVMAKSVISKSGLPNTDYVINPYVGCSHACIYCYARFMKRFTGHTEPWGTFVDVKVNAPELIPSKIGKLRGKSVYLSSVTDPYMPLEAKYRLTRRILERLIPHKPELSIQTKSDLVLRDIDLIKQFRGAEVGLTITTLDDAIRREIEPGASSVEARLNALKELKSAGLGTYVFIGPIMPYLTDWKKILDVTSQFTDHYLIDQLNPYASVWGAVMAWLRRSRPNLVESYEAINKGGYWEGLSIEISEFCAKRRLQARVIFPRG